MNSKIQHETTNSYAKRKICVFAKYTQQTILKPFLTTTKFCDVCNNLADGVLYRIDFRDLKKKEHHFEVCESCALEANVEIVSRATVSRSLTKQLKNKKAILLDNSNGRCFFCQEPDFGSTFQFAEGAIFVCMACQYRRDAQ